MAEPDHKRCLGCGYILDGLPEPRCPECGRGFDLGDPETYAIVQVDARFCLWAALCGVAAIAGALPMLWTGLADDASRAQRWGHGLGIALVGLGIVCMITALLHGFRLLGRPRYSVAYRGAALAACVIVLLPVGGCVGTVLYSVLMRVLR